MKRSFLYWENRFLCRYILLVFADRNSVNFAVGGEYELCGFSATLLFFGAERVLAQAVVAVGRSTGLF
jgi:hypothetical protein